MGWKYVYNRIEKLLESEEFKKENLFHNPNNPKDAIKIALVKLVCKYWNIDEYEGYNRILEAIGTRV